MTGYRKAKQTTRTQVILLIGFAIAALLEVPAELFWVLAAGLGVNQGSFIWGNTREWAAREGNKNATTTPTPPPA